MITCQNATFIHVPKCGGTYLRTILDGKYSLHEECALPSIYNAGPMIGFVRNPYTWYVSWYNFKNTGSDIYKSNDIYKMCNRGPMDFETYLDNLVNPTIEFKKRYYSVLQTFDVIASLYQVAATWIKSDKPFYEHLYDSYLVGHEIHKNETMTQDLPSILSKIGMYTPDVENKIKTTDFINTSKKVDYRDYYTEDMCKSVLDSHQRILTVHDYKF